MKKYTEYFNNIINHLPFSYHWILRRAIGGECSTILDLGCGDGELMQDLSMNQSWQIDGVELYLGSIKKAKEKEIYHKIYKDDVSDLSKKIVKKSYDVVFSSQVIEHLTRRDGLRCLKRWESINSKRVIIATTEGFMKFHRVEYSESDKNPLQKHRSGWKASDFRSNGYSVYGQGWKIIYGENGLIRKSPKIMWPFLILFSYIMAGPVYFFPDLGTYIIAVKVK